MDMCVTQVLVLSLSKSVNVIVVNFAASALKLDSKTASATATSIIHPKFEYCNSLYYNLLMYCGHSSQILLHHSNPTMCFLAQNNQIHQIKLLSLTCLHTKFSHPSNIHICATSSLFSLLAPFVLHLTPPRTSSLLFN